MSFELRVVVPWSEKGDYLDGRRLTDRLPSVSEVVAWLREQGAGEEDRWCVLHNLPLAPGWNCCLSQMWTGSTATCDVVKVLVIPLAGVPEKESSE